MLTFFVIVALGILVIAILGPRIIHPNGVPRRGYFLVCGIALACVIVYGGAILGYISVATLNANVHYLVSALLGCCFIVSLVKK